MAEQEAAGRPPSLLRPHDTAFCPLYHQAIELIGRRWAGAVLRALLAGETRFTEIGAACPGVSNRLLSQRLKEFEQNQLVTRIVHPVIPVRIEYRLTDRGAALSDVVNALTTWADDWLADDAPPHDD